MAKQLNVDLNVRANTSDAKKQILDLQQALNQVSSKGLDSGKMREAAAAAKELSIHLNNAMDVNTGKLNLNAFNASLKKSNSSVQTLSMQLLSAGTTGQAAFIKLAQSIAAADRPLISVGTRLSGLLTTLKNTARWQISSSILHGFMGAIQSAYGYAQDLNESLNNIRIVTGQSVSDMAKFAEQANKAAKALSTTTTAYADAALIYYQQGLKGKDVTDRTDVTMKLANVSRQSAEEVSSQLTAIWNNFADGSKSLEYYADVITKLGASTAASSEEISSGLQKFAAVADTVGLSYEKATAALATVVAETRQSADVVGTAFKTMFARFQGLGLGETLEDGVDLNKYSKALATIGVNILDANGELKVMDDILDETAEKWNQISEAQRVALAETVAGTRQYAQFMAIMNNYDKIQANQGIAAGSEGTLQRQADIYAESWEAASKRVKAAAQGLYNDLLDDKFFIGLNNELSKIISGVDTFIEGLGGLKPLLAGIAGILLNVFSGKIAAGFETLKISLTTMFQTPLQQADAYAKKMQEIQNVAKNAFGINLENASYSDQTALNNANALAVAKNKAMIASKDLTLAEKQAMEVEMSLIETQSQISQSIADEIDAEQKHINTLMDEMSSQEALSQIENLRKDELRARLQEEAEARAALKQATEDVDIIDAAEKYEIAQQATQSFKEKTIELAATQENLNQAMRNGFEQLLQFNAGVGGTSEVIVDLGSQLTTTTGEIEALANGLQQNELGNSIKTMAEYRDEIRTLGIETDDVKAAFDNFNTVSKNSSSTLSDYKTAILNVAKVLANLKITAENTGDSFDQMRQRLIEMEGGSKNVVTMERSYSTLGKKIKELEAAQKNLNNAVKQFDPTHMQTGIEIVSKLSGSIMSAAMVMNSFKSIINALNDEDMSFGERLTAIMMGLGMGIPSAISAFQAFSKVITTSATAVDGLNKILAANAAVEAAYTAAKAAQEAAMQKITQTRYLDIAASRFEKLTTEQNAHATLEEVAADQAARAIKEGLIAKEQEQAVAQALVNAQKEKGSALTKEEIAQILLETGVKEGSTTATKANIVVRLAHAIAAKTEASAIASVWMALGLLAVAIAAVIAATALLVVGIKNAIDAYNADIIAAKQTAKASEELRKAYEDTAQAAEELKSAFDNYDEAVNALNECTKGTEEWYNALKNVNDIVLDLIAKNPELASMMKTHRDENGMLVIDNKDEILAAANQKVDNARAASVMGQVSASQANLRSNQTKTYRRFEEINYSANSEIDPGMALRNSVRSNVINNASDYANLTLKEFQDSLKDQGLDLVGEHLEDFYNAIRDLANQSENLSNQMENSANALAEAELGEDYTAAEKEIASEAYEKIYQSEYQKALDSAKAYNRWQGRNALENDPNSVWNQYLKATGKQGQYTLSGNAIIGNEQHREFQFTEGTSTEKQKVSAEEMAAAIAAANALQQLGASADKASILLNKVGEDSAIAKLLGKGNLEDLSENEINELNRRITDEASFKDFYKLSDEDYEMLGGTEFFDKFMKSLEIDFNSITNSFTQSIKGALNNTRSGLTYSEQKGLGQVYQKTYGALGSEGLQDLVQNSIHKMTADQKKSFIQLANSFDWVNGSVDDLTTSLKQAGINVDELGLTDWIKSLKEAKAGVKDLNEVEKEIAEVNKVLKSVKKGDTISADDFAKLPEGLEQYFVKMADGTYKLIADATEFYNVVQGKQIGDFQKIREQAQSQNNALDAALGAGYSLDELKRDNSISNLYYRNEAYASSKYNSDSEVDRRNAQFSLLEATGWQNQSDENAFQFMDWKEHGIPIAEYENFIEVLNEATAAYTDFEDVRKANIDLDQESQNGIASMTTSYGELEASVNNNKLNSEAFGQGLLSLAAEYPSCTKAAEAYRKQVEKLGPELAAATDEFKEFDKLVKAANVTKATKNILELAKGFEQLSREEKAINAQQINEWAKTIFGQGVNFDEEYIEKHIQEFIKLGDSDQKVAEETANSMVEDYGRVKLAQDNLAQGDTDNIKFTVDTEDGVQELEGFSDLVEALLAQDITIEIDAETGRIDFGNIEDKLNNVKSLALLASGAIKTFAQSNADLNVQGIDYVLFLLDAAEKAINPEAKIRLFTKAVQMFSRVNINASGQADINSDTTLGKYSGGGGSKQTTKVTEPEEHRYTRVENNVDTLSDQYDRLAKAREKAWGVDKLGTMDSEIQKMEKLGEAYKDYLKEVAGTDWEKLHKKIQEGSSITEADIKASGGYLNKDYTSIMNGKTFTIVVDTDSEGNQTTKDFTIAGLTSLLGEYGITGLELDDYGRINNMDEINTAFESYIQQQYDKVWNKPNNVTWQNSVEGKTWLAELDKLQEEFPKLFELYNEDIKKLIENSDALQENTYATQEVNFNQLNEELDLWIDISERTAKSLEYTAKILGDNFYKIAEVMKTLYNPEGNSQYQIYLDTAEEYQQYYKNAKVMYEADEISPAQFIEAAKTAQEGIYGVIDSILEMNSQMREYYGQALDGAVEELAKLTDQMDHQIDVMGHLKNVLSLLNKETDYKALNILLQGTVQMRKNRFDASLKEYKMFNEQRIKAEEKYNDLVKTNEEGAAEYKKAVLDKIVAQTNEAEAKMYEDAEAYLEAVNELYTNTINDIMAKQEKLLTDNFGYDFLTEAMDRASSIQEEYLTKTNQLYETNTLLRKLSQDIDKTDNIAAKTKLKNFSSEIEAMQKQERLSQSDLEIAKARYELLLAQIALEEAQNAKSTVRLQRDSEGNYGYVYTADQNKVADAEQNLADKQNSLYNLSLNQTNKYGQKIISLEKERDAALMALAEEYRGAEGEKYNEYLSKRQELTEQYNELLYAAYDGYDKGIMWLNRTAVTDYQESWVTGYDTVINKGREYESQTKDVISEIETAMKDYQTFAEEVTTNTALGIDNLEKKTSNLVTANQNLVDQLDGEDGLISKLSDEIKKVDTATLSWANLYTEIMNNVKALQDYNKQTINTDINALSYDANTDYSLLMKEHLENGGSIYDNEYLTLQKQREVKINNLNMDEQKYAVRGKDTNDYIIGMISDYSSAIKQYIKKQGYTTVEQAEKDEYLMKLVAARNNKIAQNPALAKYVMTLEELLRFDTGGYTGTWGNEGKLAMLHQKELVLNQEDTANMLASIQIIRELAQAIDLRAAASSLSSSLSSIGLNANSQVLEQQVTIHAEFPNAIDHNEIEQAFTDLVNKASQYANRY